MDASKLRDLAETLEIDEETALMVSALSDQGLRDMVGKTLDVIINGPEHLNPALGAYIALGIEAAERRITKEKPNG